MHVEEIILQYPDKINFKIEVDMDLFKANPHSHLLPSVMEILNCVSDRQDRTNCFVQEGALMKGLYTNLFPVVDN